jgi:hypothetical protein
VAEDESEKPGDDLHRRLTTILPRVAMVLQIHLVIEDQINEILELQTKNFRQIEDLSFSVKFRFLKALSDKPLDWSAYKVIDLLNKIRNEVSHHPWDTHIRGSRMAFFKLRDFLGSLDWEEPYDFMNMQVKDYLYIAAFYVTNSLSEMIEDLK